MRGLLSFVALLVIVALVSGTGCRHAASSDIDGEEQVVFYPTSAYLDEGDRSWIVPIHGAVYEPESSSVSRRAMVGAIRRVVRVDDGSPEAELLDRRVRHFLVDYERGKHVSVRIGEELHQLGESEANGHFRGTLRLSTEEVARAGKGQGFEGRLVVEAVVPDSDERSFRGSIALIGPVGLSIISDIDDTIKHSQVGDHRAVLTNTFLREFEPVPGMPELYRTCAASGFAFHYVSGSPWQLFRPLASFLEAEGFPHGSFDLKLFRLKDPSTVGMLTAHQTSKLAAIEPILEAYPGRRFVLIGDSGEQDPEIYAQVAAEHPDQIVAVFIRNVTDETIDDDRYRTRIGGLGDVEFRLFDRSEELRPRIEQIIRAIE